jgi:7,8-dihydropterin-6-yl-methyl-4-(beta-D-ribofuranosyl)aminobenzene 5'-phosphate synthase
MNRPAAPSTLLREHQASPWRAGDWYSGEREEKRVIGRPGVTGPPTAPKDAGAVLGECASVSFTAVSEVGWFDTDRMLAELEPYGGLAADQWQVALDPANAAGSCTLAQIEGIGGETTRFLIDTGWNSRYMDERFAATGVDRLLRERQIAFLYLTHEHLDHFWGIESVLRLDPGIKVVAPVTLREEGRRFLAGASFAGVANRVPHEGELVLLEPDRLHPLLPGCASVGFDLPIVLSVRGEQSLVFRLRDRGLVLATGCCHQGIDAYAHWVRTVLPGERLHGLYGGLHIAPFGPLTDEQERSLQRLGSYGFERLAVNHCTGARAVERMGELGYPLVTDAAGVRDGETVRFD